MPWNGAAEAQVERAVREHGSHEVRPRPGQRHHPMAEATNFPGSHGSADPVRRKTGLQQRGRAGNRAGVSRITREVHGASTHVGMTPGQPQRRLCGQVRTSAPLVSPVLTTSDGVSRHAGVSRRCRPKVGKLSATTSGTGSKSYDKQIYRKSGRYDITVIDSFLGSPNASGGSDANGEMAPVRHNGRLERCEEPGPFRLRLASRTRPAGGRPKPAVEGQRRRPRRQRRSQASCCGPLPRGRSWSARPSRRLRAAGQGRQWLHRPRRVPPPRTVR